MDYTALRNELVYQQLGRIVVDNFLKSQFDVEESAQSQALLVLLEIQKILRQADTDDFKIVEEIVCVFEKYGISAGGCHDFG